MPISKYDTAFGGKKGAASKALAAMRDQYGDKKGTQVFYATKNKRGGRHPRHQMLRQFHRKHRHG